MELGGNAPFIVFEDADLDAAVEGVLVSKYRNAGQTCVCANRLYVHAKVYDAFAQKLVAAVQAMPVGDGLQDGTRIGARKSVVWGKSVSVRLDLGGRRIIQKNKHILTRSKKTSHN